tara:strand:- start:87584 stop:88846 length:1263 start_codon:yes stop_codon:yes gene_type:complete
MLSIGLVFANPCMSQSYVEYFNFGREALDNKDTLGFRNHMFKADSIRPNHQVIMYNLAKGYALNNETEKAFEILTTLSQFYASEGVLDSTDFQSLIEEEKWKKLKASIEKSNEVIISSELAFEINKTGFHPEGIIYDEEFNHFFISDIRSGLIYRTDKEGKELGSFANLSELGFWSPMGMKIDPSNTNLIWVATSAVDNFENFEPEMKGKSAVLLFDKKTGKLLEQYIPEEDGHSYGDLFVTSKGEVFVTDSQTPVIYKLDRRKSKITEAFSSKEWWSLQGITSSLDGTKLFVSDYITGIFVINVLDGRITPLITENYKLRSTDGLYLKGDQLIAIQNGTLPKRIAAISLNQEGTGISSSLKYLDQAREELEEPTLGTWVNGDLYYIANSPWGYYDEEMNPKYDEWPILKVLRLRASGIK